MHKIGPVLLAALMLLVAACSAPVVSMALVVSSAATAPAVAPSTAATTLTVFAAASLSGPFDEIARSFEVGYPGVKVVLDFAGSQQLAQQLALGAPADVFASASQAPMDAAVQAGRVPAGSDRIFAHNRLISSRPSANPAHIEGLADLTQPGVTIVLAAKEVPASQYSLDFLQRASGDGEHGPRFA